MACFCGGPDHVKLTMSGRWAGLGWAGRESERVMGGELAGLAAPDGEH